MDQVCALLIVLDLFVLRSVMIGFIQAPAADATRRHFQRYD